MDTIKVSKLFSTHDNLEIKLSLSIKHIKKETNDSTFMVSNIAFLESDGSWHSLETEIRVRGNYRLDNCYFPPLKLKIRKSERKGTVFKGNKKLKLVLPCSNTKSGNDYVVKEYLAYRLYEIISPYHLKTRMVEVTFDELKGKNVKTHHLKGILIEDIEKVADRFDGNVYKRSIHPLNQNALSSVQNAFFQFMIGNTDFSTAYQHNEKLLFINKDFIPVPYDFDMSGLVNTHYSVVSSINEENLSINSVTERLYRGFKRDPKILLQVKQDFLTNQESYFKILNSIEEKFEDPKNLEESKNYIRQFFEILKDDKKFNEKITRQLRTK